MPLTIIPEGLLEFLAGEVMMLNPLGIKDLLLLLSGWVVVRLIVVEK